MNCLILGSTGYLGSKLIHALVDEGCSVVGTTRETSDTNGLDDIMERIRLIPAAAGAVETSMQYEDYDWVINVSGNYGRSTRLYQSVLQSNIDFPLYILDLAAENGIPNYMTISTGLPEELNMYSFSKGIFARFGRFYSDKHGINFFNMKLQMFYGSDEPLDRFLPGTVYKMIRGMDIEATIGTQHRDIIAVEDVVGAIMCVLKSRDIGYHDVDVGTGLAPSIHEVLEYLREQTGSSGRINYGAVALRDGEPDCVADLTDLNRYGYKLKYSWQTGLSKMIREMQEHENTN